MKKLMTVSYQHRQSLKRDLPTSPKIVIANHFLKELSGFSIGDKVLVHYSPNQIIITKQVN